MQILAILLAGLLHVHNDDGLKYASSLNRLGIVKLLLEHKANVHAEYDYSLKEASLKGYTDVVKVLLEAKADVHATDDESLLLATCNKHIGVVKMLLEAKANVQSRDNQSIKVASGLKNAAIVALLLKYSADPKQLNSAFISQFMSINGKNLSYLFDLEASGVDLSEIPNFDYDSYQQVKVEINAYIEMYLGHYINKIVTKYI